MTLIDWIFLPLLSMPQTIAIIIISFLIGLVMTLAYKWMTDQTKMCMLRDDLKKYQKLMKENNDASKILELQKKAMDTNMQYLMHSLKPTLITMLPILIIFSWLSSHYAYEPLYPDKEFSVTVYTNDGITGNIVLEVPENIVVDGHEKAISGNSATWKVKAKAGDYLFKFKAQENEYDKDIIVSSAQIYATPEKKVGDGIVEKIKVNMQELIMLNLFGWEIGWLGTYILFSIIFSMSLRKILGVH